MTPGVPDLTAVDRAWLAQETADDEALRRRFHERLLDAELFVLLEEEPTGETLRPQIFDLDEGRFVLAFDRDLRLAAFFDAPAPYAALSGRRLAAMLSGQGIGIGLNLGVAPSSVLLPAEAVDWMSAMADATVRITEARLSEIRRPHEAPEALITALDPKLAAMAHHIDAAHLVAVGADAAIPRFLLVLTDVPEAARLDVASAIGEAVRFAGLDPAILDVTYLETSAPVSAAVARVALTFELPRPAAATTPPAPGSDPARPPKLR